MLNVLAIHGIRKTSSLPRTLRTLLMNLAVSDVGVGLIICSAILHFISIQAVRRQQPRVVSVAPFQLHHNYSRDFFSLSDSNGLLQDLFSCKVPQDSNTVPASATRSSAAW